MVSRIVPGRTAILALAVTAAALLVGLVLRLPLRFAMWIALAALVAVPMLMVWDYVASRRAWIEGSPRLTRQLPSAFAVGVRRTIPITIVVEGSGRWRCDLHDHADASLATEGLPMTLVLEGGQSLETSYTAVATRRGEVTFAPAHVRVRSRWGLCELIERIGETEQRRVYPDFAQVARYAWLAGDRRLQEIGIKTYQQRGEGTDFKELAEYRPGDAIRHIDWRATSRLAKPIVRHFQDERDQCVMLLVDCGRRMRASEGQTIGGTTHFDQVLNAVMLLGYVALNQGDAVGALTFGTPRGEERTFPPRKGKLALNALMGQLYAVQPTLAHSDYVAAARHLLSQQLKRSLVIVITNFRDEDNTELGQALRLLRSRHLVMLASLRERVVRELMEQPVTSGDAAIDVASAHLYEQSRRDAFNRLAARDALMVDAEPERLGIELVNRYHSVKRAGLI